MNDRAARNWSWILTAVCCLYIVWIARALTYNLPSLALALAGLGAELVPKTTRFVLAFCHGPAPWLLAGVLVVLLILKERLLRSCAVRIAVTTLVFMAVSWFADFATFAVLGPLVEVTRRIGG